MSISNIAVRVARKSLEAVDICSYELVTVDGKDLPTFSAGSHIDVLLPNGITRQYSLCNDPMESHRYHIAVLKDAATRGGSQAMHEAVQQGDILQISAPKNHFPLVHEADNSLLLAGGIGVTPILCMAQRLAISGVSFEMHYCARSKERMAFHQRISGATFADKVSFHFDDGAPDQKLDMVALLAKPKAGTHLYVCGPKGFMDAALRIARAAGWPEQQLHYEFFSAEVIHLDNDGSFDVQLASSGKIVRVAKDKTVFEALADAGVQIETSCEQGVCGTCLTRVLQGTPDHRDSFMTPQEHALNDQFTPCCSRAKSALLVLDL